MHFKLTFSPVFTLSLRRLNSFLTRKFSAEVASTTKQQLKTVINERLSTTPMSGPVCDRLLDLGVAGYRQLVVDKHNTVIYRVNENQHEVTVLLVFDTRQSLEKLLTDVNLQL